MKAHDNPWIKPVEKIQEKSFSWLGEDLNEILRFNSHINAPFRPDEEHIRKSLQTGNAHTTVLPERLFIPPERLADALLSGGLTKYDDSNFFARFANTEEFLHQIFADGIDLDRKEIHITSLPFLSINGFCQKVSKNDYIVFLNSGITTFLPVFFRNLLPSLDANLFGNPRQGNFGAMMTLMSNLYVSGRGAQFFGEDFQLFSFNEKWYFQECLRHDILNRGEKIEHPLPNKMPHTSGAALYYANRGASIFLLAHEFAHAYLGHTDKRNSLNILRSDSELKSARSLLMAHGIPDTQISQALKNNRGYLTLQPIETEADAHAMAAVLAYCDENELSEKSTTCVVIGVFALFFVLELHERLVQMARVGFENVTDGLSGNVEVMNILSDRDHPIPLSRVSLLLQQNVMMSIGSEARGLKNMDAHFIPAFEHYWLNVAAFEKSLVKAIRQSPYLEDAPEDLFDGLSEHAFHDNVVPFVKPGK